MLLAIGSLFFSSALQAISITIPAPSGIVLEDRARARNDRDAAVSRALRPAFSAARVAITRSNWQACVAALQSIEPDATQLDFDRYSVAELLAYCAQRAGNNSLASSALEESLRYPQFSGDVFATKIEVLAQIRFLAGDYTAAEKFGSQAIELGRRDDENYILVADALMNLERFIDARRFLEGWLKYRSADRADLAEPILEKYLYACSRLGDPQCRRDAMELLIAFYPSERGWKNLVSLILEGAEKDDAQKAARLAHEFSIGLEPSDYTFIGSSLIDSGYPAEAAEFLDAAISRKLLKDARYIEAAKKIISRAKSAAETDARRLVRREEESARSSSAELDFNLGRELLFRGQVEKSIAVINRGVSKSAGSVPDEARVTLGIAYLRQGDTAKASESFYGLSDDGLQGALKRAWLLAIRLRSSNPSTGYTAFADARLSIAGNDILAPPPPTSLPAADVAVASTSVTVAPDAASTVAAPSSLVLESVIAPPPAPAVAPASVVEKEKAIVAAVTPPTINPDRASQERLNQEIARREQEIARREQELARRDEERRQLLAMVEAAAKRQRELEEELKRQAQNVATVSEVAESSRLAPATRRFALAIGNNRYQSIPALERAVNDAVSVAEGLRKIGYETNLLTDATQRQINSAVNRFVRDVAEGGQGVLFYAGHGIQINNQNFLLPVDFDMPSTELDVLDQAVSLQVIQDKLTEAKSKFALLIVDACRDNPLPRRALRSIAATRGLAQASSADGQMVVFSAGANQQALDKLGDDDKSPNGLFTRELLPWFERDDVSIRNAILEVRRSVNAKAREINHQQTPAVYDQLIGDFYFRR